MSVEQPGRSEPFPGEDRFEPFDLTVNLGPDAIPWLSASSRVGFVHGIPRRSPALPALPELLNSSYDYADAIRYAEAQPEPELTHTLGELVFGDPVVLQLFQATRGVAADRGRQLLVRILTAPHLAGLPWELLPDPAYQAGEGQRYLVLAPHTHLVRLARGRNYAARASLLKPPLNLLLVLSSPTPRNPKEEEEQSFDIFEVKRALLAELEELQQTGMLHVDVVDQPTLDNLRRQIGTQQRGYHLFHYVGHAEPDRLILEDRAGERKDIQSDQFMKILRLCPDLRLAVFAGCNTARAARDPATLDTRTASWRDLLSLADTCVQDACPAVIGMQAVLPFTTERVFTRFFYQALAHGYSIADALQFGRGAVQGDEHRTEHLLEWSVPALFIGNSDPGPLLSRAESAPVKPAAARAELKLGLRQSSGRFFGRELPLRQAVEVLAGKTTERVLMITGPIGVGKTELMDRTLEELGTAATHVLYVSFDRLAPEIALASSQLASGALPDLRALAALDPNDALDHLCRLVVELLRDQITHPRDPAWKAKDWWERLVEDLVHHKFVLAIEDIALDRVQRGLLERLVDQWLESRTAADPENKHGERLLNKQLHLLSQLQESLEGGEADTQPTESPLAAALAELEGYLEGLPDRLVKLRAEVLKDALERQVIRLSVQETDDAASSQAPTLAIIEPAEVKGALNQLEQVRHSLSEALCTLAERRSPARLAITTAERPSKFLDLPDDMIFEMRLAPLGWPEIWRWIRLYLPLLSSYRDALNRLWPQFGIKLDRWEELERRVLQKNGQTVDLQQLADGIAPRRRAASASSGAVLAKRGARALRIAVAGPHLAGPQELANAISRLASEYGIGGRVVLDASETAAMATLIEAGTPFDKDGQSTAPQILKWLRGVLEKQPDVILLDYASITTLAEIQGPQSRDPVRTLLRSVQHRTLLIAAGGNKTEASSEYISIPAGYPEVLGVGPLDNAGGLREYAEWHPEIFKPDLFMVDDLIASKLATMLKPELLDFHRQHQTWGSSFSALHAVVAATLVWSLLPELTPRAVRELLLEASQPVPGNETARGLKMEAAISLARRRAVELRLKEGPASLQTLGAMTGLNAQLLADTLGKMENVVRLTSGRLVRYQLLPPKEVE
jgi:hypothetical protein